MYKINLNICKGVHLIFIMEIKQNILEYLFDKYLEIYKKKLTITLEIYMLYTIKIL